MLLADVLNVAMQTGDWMTGQGGVSDMEAGAGGNILVRYLPEALMLVLGALVGWFPTRRKQRADTRRVEIEVLEAAIKTLNTTVVEPLAARLNTLQDDYEELIEELRRLKNAINKAYNCKHITSCPIRDELQRQERNVRPRHGGERSAHRQREPCSSDHAETDCDPETEGDADFEPG